jgi:hypothetical protein
MDPTARRLRAARARLSMTTYRHRHPDMAQADLTTRMLALLADVDRRRTRRLLAAVLRPRPEGTAR